MLQKAFQKYVLCLHSYLILVLSGCQINRENERSQHMLMPSNKLPKKQVKKYARIF